MQLSAYFPINFYCIVFKHECPYFIRQNDLNTRNNTLYATLQNFSNHLLMV